MSNAMRPPAYRHPGFHGRIGIARRDITPPVGIYARNWGAARHEVATSIHRPLTLTAMTVVSLDGGDPLVFVDADLGWWRTLNTFDSFADRLCASLALDRSRLIFALSHTHAGPPLGEFDSALPGASLLAEWMERFREAAAAAISQAMAEPFEAALEWHTGRCGLASVRDFPDPALDQARIVCGFNPETPADDMLLVGRITDSERTLRGTLINYACHPTTLAWDNRAISPDYVGAMRATIQQVTGAPAIFMLGACGELAPRHQYVGDPEIADAHGRQLAYASLAVLEGMEPPRTQLTYAGVVESGAPLALWRPEPRPLSVTLRAVHSHVDLPVKDWPSADQLERERRDCSDRALQERLRRKRDIRLGLGDGATFRLPIHAWRVGDTVIVGTCCEAYSILQREIRRRFPEQAIVCMNLINGSIGYLPPAELYDADVYPVWQTPFDRGSLELTMESMIQAIHDVLAE